MVQKETAQRSSKEQKHKKQSQWGEIWHRLRKNKAAMVGLVVIVVTILIAIFADLIIPYSKAVDQNAIERLMPPSAEHIFGTDGYGRDVFARVVHGARNSLFIAILASSLSLIVGGLLGAIAGFYGGIVDSIIMRFMDVLMCIPGILLSLAVVAALGTDLIFLLLAVTVSTIPGTTRLVRSTVLTVVGQDYIEAARSYGGKGPRIILKYVLPNAIGPIIVNTTMGIASMILAVSSLSFIGLGIQPPSPEWGNMLSDARTYIGSKDYLMIFPGIAIIISALSINLLGDGLRDALDPKLKN